MRRRTAIRAVAAALVAVLAAGCGTSPSRASLHEDVALGALRPSTGGAFAFGAGDALGEAVFARYVVSVRAWEQYAAAADEAPVD